MTRAALARFLENPFYVLGVDPDVPRVEIERQGQKLLAMLELGLASARSYATPVGRGERTPDKVRLALAELRDPEKRVIHEVFARLPADAVVVEPAAATDAPWPDALRALGYGGRR